MTMTQSRAVVMERPRALRMRHLTLPDEPPRGGAIMKVLANGICGSDWDVYSGGLTAPAGKPTPFPMVPGHEPVGRIVAIDPAAADAWGVAVDDRIVIESKIRCGTCSDCRAGRTMLCRRARLYSLITVDEGPGLWGGMAEYMVLRPGTTVFPVADSLSDLDASLFNPWGNAYYWVVETGRAGVGDRVLILGGGQRGIACAAVAAEAGAAQVIVTGLDRDIHKLTLAERFGATATINVEHVDTVAAVHDLTDGDGVDVVVDTVPSTAVTLHHAVECVRAGGTIVLAGVKHPTIEFPAERFRSKQLRISGVSGTTPTAVAGALRILGSGRHPLGELHSHTFGLDEAERAIRTLGGEIPDADPIHVAIVP